MMSISDSQCCNFCLTKLSKYEQFYADPKRMPDLLFCSMKCLSKKLREIHLSKVRKLTTKQSKFLQRYLETHDR
jgi:hypothetical protein